MNVAVQVEKKAAPILRRKAIEDVFKEFGDLVLTRAEELVPVDTGDLYRSLRVESSRNGFSIIAGEGLPDARAVYQEYGFHHYQTGAFIINPFIRPAVEQYRERILAELVAAIALGR